MKPSWQLWLLCFIHPATSWNVDNIWCLLSLKSSEIAMCFLLKSLSKVLQFVFFLQKIKKIPFSNQKVFLVQKQITQHVLFRTKFCKKPGPWRVPGPDGFRCGLEAALLGLPELRAQGLQGQPLNLEKWVQNGWSFSISWLFKSWSFRKKKNWEFSELHRYCPLKQVLKLTKNSPN